jgi:UDP-3-O-[3-hydroxymyristoyl] N-acetylglucosamine deacetylase
MKHQSLQTPATISGVGLHSGEQVKVRLLPAESPGVVFVRRDLPNAPRVAATLKNVTSTTHATTLRQGDARVSTTEHLLATLWALGVTACTIELDGPEVPILDGSALPWVRLIEATGVCELPECGERPIFRLAQPVWIGSGEMAVLGVPCEDFRLTCAVEYQVACGGKQIFDGVVTSESFSQELAPARTFTLESWLEPLRSQGLVRGGSLDNAIVLKNDGPSSPFRFPNELARHKALDVVGDLALMFAATGGIFHGHISALRAGHGPHRDWMKACALSLSHYGEHS